MLADGHDKPPVRLRKHDEFRELAASSEKLSIAFKGKGMLE
jgi:hypothetical protein